MNEREFLDLLRYYFRKVKPEDVEEILSDYKAHFTEARERGLSDAQIAAELGHPEDIYASYQSEGIVSEKTKMEKISDNAEYLADKAQQKMQQTWNEVSPHIPDAASATASVLPKHFLPFVRFCPYSFSRPRCLPFIYYLCILLPLWMRIPYRDSTR